MAGTPREVRVKASACSSLRPLAPATWKRGMSWLSMKVTWSPTCEYWPAVSLTIWFSDVMFAEPSLKTWRTFCANWKSSRLMPLRLAK